MCFFENLTEHTSDCVPSRSRALEPLGEIAEQRELTSLLLGSV